MSLYRLAWQSLRFYWRIQLGTVLAIAVCASVLTGALLVGDTVRYSLRRLALARVGQVHVALATGSSFCRQELARDLAAELQAPMTPVLRLAGSAARPDGARVNHVNVLGVEPGFWPLFPAAAAGPPGPSPAAAPGLWLSQRLAAELGARPGDPVVLRVERPSLLSRDALLAALDRPTVALRLPVAGIVPDAAGGLFSPRVEQAAPRNAFVPLEVLAPEVGLPGRANLLLGGDPAGRDPAAALRRAWRLEDAGLRVRALPGGRGTELASDAVFLPAPAVAALQALAPAAEGVLSWFVNSLEHGDRRTPYSFVSAVGRLDTAAVPAAPPLLRPNQWLAADLGLQAGSEVTLRYYVDEPDGGGGRLAERQMRCRVGETWPMSAADPSLMPEFPGLAGEEDCRAWHPGIPVALDRIRERDEAYWREYRGTPKALLDLAAGQALWANRFGSLTALRLPAAAWPPERLAAALRDRLDPAGLGLQFVPLRAAAWRGSAQGTDFGGLFLGLSFFLIAGALLLAALVFSLGVTPRTAQLGTLRALGFAPGQVLRLMWLEGLVLAVAGGVLGALGAWGYMRLLVHLLGGVWSRAVVGSPLVAHSEPASLALGAGASVLVAWLAIALALRHRLRRPVRELLAGEDALAAAPAGRSWGLLVAGLAGLPALVLLAWGWGRGAGRDPELFFAAGALALGAVCGLAHWGFGRLGRGGGVPARSLAALAWRNLGRRPGRSLACFGMLACGSFLVAAVGAFRQDPLARAGQRASGTGGFALYAETTQPLPEPLGRAEGRRRLGLDPKLLARADIVSLRLREGDDASCLNLNRAQQPGLLGVDPAALASRGAFRFRQTQGTFAASPWELLRWPGGAAPVPAVMDADSIVYGLGRQVGDVLECRDERGQSFPVQLVGGLAGSLLPGALWIDERAFRAKYPGNAGYRVFLIDIPPGLVQDMQKELAFALEDHGLEVQPAEQRLALFLAVYNSYIGIFMVLGGLGLILGSLGLGVLVWRHAAERRGELALGLAVGFSRAQLGGLLLAEQAWLLALGLSAGGACALAAVAPAVLAPGGAAALAGLGWTLVLAGGAGLGCIALAARAALAGPLLEALRKE